jgi:hypothetical protein
VSRVRCLYPLRDSDNDACALSWVRESHAHLDTPLWHAVSEWLESDWPFARIRPRRSGVETAFAPLVRERLPGAEETVVA